MTVDPIEALLLLSKQIAPELKPIVEAIESSPEGTKGRYDQYMAAITRLATMLEKPRNKVVMTAMGVALCRAGANQNGVRSALRALGAFDA